MNGKPFRGTITPKEAKHIIYKECLGFADFTNFDGVRFGFKGMPIAVFKLKTAINVDELLCVQYFEFKRAGTRMGRYYEDIIGCKIRGLRSRQTVGDSLVDTGSDDGTRIVKVEGCEYRITKEQILSWLELYGEVQSDVVEDCFDDDSEDDGTNRTGIYSVKMKLDMDIPQLLPMAGRRIKIYYRGIQKLCTNCFGKHTRRVCQSIKVPWFEYVRKFRTDNHEIPDELYGKWIEILNKTAGQDSRVKNSTMEPIIVNSATNMPNDPESRPKEN